VLLVHQSQEKQLPELAYETVRDIETKQYKCDSEIKLDLAPRNWISSFIY
jgi:hypothetical protein